MVNKNTMDMLNKLGFGADIDSLETYVASLQDAAAMGSPIVDDAAYDKYFALLKQLKPDSVIFQRNWESEETELTEYDKVLNEYGMCSITTITSLDGLRKFKDTLNNIGHPVNMAASIKENGHGVRAVYLNGKLYKGSTRGRYKKGRDITRHLKAVLPNYIEQWKDTEIMEVRGEMLVSIENFENHLRNTLKTPLSSVTSLIRDSVTDEELKYLDMVCYKVISGDGSISFDTLSDEFEHLKSCGFKVPEGVKIPSVTSENLDTMVETVLNFFEQKMDNNLIAYACDGIVFAIDDNNLFYSTGKDGNAWKGNFALKMGKYWEQNIYSSVIQEVIFIMGKTYITPKAVITPVKTGTGTEVTKVPLYNIGVMERYHYVPGETVYFRFGGETGVTLCDELGRSVSESN